MANTVSVLSYANTFGDWVVTTNALVRENNSLAANNYTKSTGTLYLSDPTLGLQVGNNAVVAGQLQVQGTGSSARIQNNLTVTQGQVYFQNTTLGLINSGELIANGKISAAASGTGLAVSNNSTIGGTLSVTGATALGNTLSVTRATTLSNTLAVTGISTFTSNVNAQNYLNVSQDVNAINFIGTGSVNSYGLSVIGNGSVSGQFSVGGNFVINGSTVYNTNKFEINANSIVGLTSYYSVNRGSSANAQIRWNEANTYWDIRDVNNPISYSKILTANLISDSLTTVNSNLLASATAANTLNTYLTANVISLQSQLDSNVTSLQAQISSNVAYIANINITQNTAILATDSKMQSAYNRANTSTFNGTTGQAIAINGVITYASNNGFIISGTANTLYLNSAQDLRTSALPTFNSLTLTNALAITQGGTGATSTSQALTNLLPTGTTAGYVLATGGPGSFYWAAGGTGGGGGSTPGTTIASTRISYTANGSGIAYTTPSYVPGASQLRVYIDGVRQFPSDYTETSNTIVSFVSSPPSGSVVLMEVDGYILNPYYANNIAYTVNSTISPTANTIQLAIDGLTSIVALKSGTTFTAAVNGITADTNSSNTSFATTAFVKNALNNSNTYTHSISGNAGTVTNGVYTNGSYSDPSWLSISPSKVSLGTGSNPQFNSLGIGTSATGTAGEIRATNNITAYYSDDRLKTRSGNIQNALAKVMTLNGFHYQANEVAQALGYTAKPEVGVSAQEVQAILPEVVVPAPIDEQYLTVHYDKLVPLLIEAIKELKAEIDTLKGSK